MSVVSDGGLGISVDPTGTQYPLVNPSPDIAGLLADFYLSHEIEDLVLPLRLAWVYGLCQVQGSCNSSASSSAWFPESSHSADVLVLDQIGQTIFDSTLATRFRSYNWGDRFHVFEWYTDTAVCRVLVHQGQNDPEDVVIYEHEFEPKHAILDERTHDILPGRVKSLTVGATTASVNVTFSSGYNFETSVATRTQVSPRHVQRITFSAEPGAGLGRYPSCQDQDTVIRLINGQGADQNGNFVLSAKDCYWLQQPSILIDYHPRLVTFEEATLRLSNNCRPCCECSDYENVYRAIRNLYAQFKDIGKRADATRNLLQENIDRWLERRNCAVENPTKLTMVAATGGYLDVLAGFCNTDDDCKYNIHLSITFMDNHGNIGVLEPHTTFRTILDGSWEEYTLGGSWPVYHAYWDAMNPMRAVRLKFRLRFPGVVNGESVTATVQPYIAEVGYPFVTKTIGLRP